MKLLTTTLMPLGLAALALCGIGSAAGAQQTLNLTKNTTVQTDYDAEGYTLADIGYGGTSPTVNVVSGGLLPWTIIENNRPLA